jgi:tRNA1Val (adenine37-N6)-methyltransferase
LYILARLSDLIGLRKGDLVRFKTVNIKVLPNSYFKFKRFTIHQDKCAMKVSTDSCLLGAWFALRIPQHATVLDIGSGTGLLMLMVAQKTKGEIHGIELDLPCFTQLQENISASDWNKKLCAFSGDARNFSFPERYDFIISNPPFFENDLASPNDEDNLARHSSKLVLRELIQAIDINLSENGSFGVVVPYSRWEYFNRLSEEKLFYPKEKVFIKHSPAHPYSRAIMHYSRSKQDATPAFELSIRRNDSGEYTDEFIDLLRDYYLYL